MRTLSKASLFSSLSIIALLAGPVAAESDRPNFDLPEQTVVAGSIGGSWFITATAIMDLVERNVDGFSYTVVPGGGVANPLSIQRGEASLGMGFTTNLYAAYNALEEPYDTPTEDLRAVLNMNTAVVMHPWMLAETGAASLAEVAENELPIRIDTGPRGTGGELAARRALEAHGISYDNIRAWGGSVTHSSYSEAIDRMRDGHIDAFMTDELIGHPLFVDLTSARDVVLLEIDPTVIRNMAEAHGYTEVVIGADTYEGQGSDMQSFAQENVLVAHKDVPEDFVYTLTKLVLENKDQLVQTHQDAFAALDPEAAPTGHPIPLHPGAERYYREIGVLD